MELKSIFTTGVYGTVKVPDFVPATMKRDALYVYVPGKNDVLPESIVGSFGTCTVWTVKSPPVLRSRTGFPLLSVNVIVAEVPPCLDEFITKVLKVTGKG